MKIGIITYHWATNYGAVLQAYALQKYLNINGYESEIINYIPKIYKRNIERDKFKKLKLDFFIKEYKLNKFRLEYLIVSKKLYKTNDELKRYCNDYDLYISGSDQIWNKYFILNAEEKPTLSYFLNFLGNGKVRISYATSFGNVVLPQKVSHLIKPELNKFKSISVRENTGKHIIENMGFTATLVLDPTLLLSAKEYEGIITNKKVRKKFNFFSYILHDDLNSIIISEYIFERYFHTKNNKKYNQEPISIIEWLYNIKNSKLVVTNSFHGIVFSIIFHTPFIALAIQNSEMNDRLYTLLNELGLNSRIIERRNKCIIDKLVQEKINWDKVDKKLGVLKGISKEYLEKAVNQ